MMVSVSIVVVIWTRSVKSFVALNATISIKGAKDQQSHVNPVGMILRLKRADLVDVNTVVRIASTSIDEKRTER
jgi:hypothetical protein